MHEQILNFYIRGERYEVNRRGQMRRTDTNMKFSDTWKFLGVSFHHWKRSVDLTVAQAFKNPDALVKGLVWDLDHGTTRQWGGRYNGRLPRIISACITTKVISDVKVELLKG